MRINGERRGFITALFLALALLLGLSGCGAAAEPDPEEETPAMPVETVNELSDQEEAQGWRLLFNGEDLSQWRGFRMAEVPDGWVVADGSIYFDAEHGGEGHGDLSTREQFSDFELALEWKISEGGNSGVFFRVSEDHDQEYMTGPEVQVIDGRKEFHPDLEETQRAGANYALHAPSKNVLKPVGEWNSLRLVVNGAHVEHWLNGEKIVEYELWTDEWKQMVADSKFAEWPAYGLNKSGHIVLQDHGAPVWYRNIKVRTIE